MPATARLTIHSHLLPSTGLAGLGVCYFEPQQPFGASRSARVPWYGLPTIDCVTFVLLQRYAPALLRGISIIASGPLAPGLPLIAAHKMPETILELIREALQQLVSEARFREIRSAALIGGFSVVSCQAYSVVLQWQEEAAARGVTQL